MVPITPFGASERGKGLTPALLLYVQVAVVVGLLPLIYSLCSAHGLPHPLVHGHDLMGFEARFQLFRRPGFWEFSGDPFTYPAPLALVFAGVYSIPHALRWYSMACGLAAVAWALWLARGLWKRGVAPGLSGLFAAVVLVTAWPVAFLLDTGNIEGVVVVTLAGGILAFCGKRWYLAAMLIGLAGAMKLFPLALLGLLLAARRYRASALGFVVAALVNVASLAIVGPTVGDAQRGVNAGLAVLLDGERIADTPVLVNHSLWALLKWGYVRVDHWVHPVAAGPGTPLWAERAAREFLVCGQLLTWYVAAAAVAGVALYLLRLRRMPTLNQILGLTLCAVLLPPVSMDYTLTHLLVPFGLLAMYAARRKGLAPGLGFCFACFAILLTAGILHRQPIEFSPLMRTVLLIALLIAVVRYPFPAQHYPDSENYA